MLLLDSDHGLIEKSKLINYARFYFFSGHNVIMNNTTKDTLKTQLHSGTKSLYVMIAEIVLIISRLLFIIIDFYSE